MKQQKWFEYVKLLLFPVLLIVLGLVLIVNPDSAAALVAKVFAWALILAGTILGLLNLLGSGRRSSGQIVIAAVCLLVGLWLLANPLVLAKGIGRFLGVVLIVQGTGDILEARRMGYGLPIVSVVIAAAGLILVLVPMTTSRILFIVIGIVSVICGVTGLVNRLRMQKLLDGGDDPSIIDVDKL